MNLEEYYANFGHLITQDSERLFVEDILYPLLGDQIEKIVPQHQFLDSSGKSRRIDFACRGSHALLALEVNGESYHAEGIVPNEMFDDNLYRQNEILRAGYKLARFSYNQLQDEKWRPIIFETVRGLIAETAPELLPDSEIEPNEIQKEALDALNYCRQVNEWRKAIVVMPTGSGKTLLSALDGKRFGGRQLFLVHRLDILTQSVEVYKMVRPTMNYGFLTGDVQENEMECDVLFASKDMLRQPNQLIRFERDAFDYIVVDEVHHGQSPSYRDILEHFQPTFMLGMTATPDRMDRKDIFEMFDYNKAYETTLHEVIERGFLVPYTYFGLTDDIDYTRIKFENNRYRVNDLERLLIIPERNKAILDQYLEKGLGDKAIGFCVSIEHAERMTDFFNENGVSAVAIHSGVQERDRLINEFRENRISVAFTVDLFNEGVDFPNVQVLMFLRPTESKTVFLQQLGRGLRRSFGKERLRVLDFIGNYQRANRIRDYLSKRKEIIEEGRAGRTYRKFKYVYSTGCEVKFTADVEEILNRQDAQELGIGKLELTEAYYVVAEYLRRRPSRNDIDQFGEYKSALYSQVFGSWSRFIREIGAYTEASYHYPQGTHVGHILSILWYFGLPNRRGTAFDDDYIRLRGGLSQGRRGRYQRQLKYKLQAAMELGLLEDDRRAPPNNDFIPRLTLIGRNLRSILEPHLSNIDLAFAIQEDGIPSTRMAKRGDDYNELVRDALGDGIASVNIIRSVVCRMPAVQQMMSFMYQVARKRRIERTFIYSNFFQTPFVKQFMEQEGIEPASEEASRRRCPFLLNLLSTAGIIVSKQNYIEVSQLILFPALVRSYVNEDIEAARQRLLALKSAWPDRPDKMDSESLSVFRELFGEKFLTSEYGFEKITIIEDF